MSMAMFHAIIHQSYHFNWLDVRNPWCPTLGSLEIIVQPPWAHADTSLCFPYFGAYLSKYVSGLVYFFDTVLVVSILYIPFLF